MQRIYFTILFLIGTCFSSAQNWDYIRTSGEYYYGIGEASTASEASAKAIEQLVDMIADHTANDFEALGERSGTVRHQDLVRRCLETYSLSAAAEVQNWVDRRKSEVVVRRYLKRQDLVKIFERRVAKATEMIHIARQAEEEMRIDMALQYYYWAYSLVCSTQFPRQAKGLNGASLLEWIPEKINEIFTQVKVDFEGQEDKTVDLKFTYGDKPISSLEYNYSDGREDCIGSAKDGRGVIELAENSMMDHFLIHVEYQYIMQARGDEEMHSVLSIVPHQQFAGASFTIENGGKGNSPSSLVQNNKKVSASKDASLTNDIQKYTKCVDRVMSSISSKRYQDASMQFTLNGLDVYNKLIAYGKGRIVGEPKVSFSKGTNGTVVARGLQMSFSFKNGKKKTFVEDVVFTFNREGKIDNVSFGLGKTSTDDILYRNAPGWSNEARETLVEFMENYKTAYCLKRYDYIESIFADDALIIVGNVVRRSAPKNNQYDGQKISVEGEKKITYNRYDKAAYLSKLKKCFNRNEFINIRFSNNDIQRLDKYKNQDLYAIQIGQEYNSSSYSDKGYLFLLIDMTQKESPLIKIRTWQPNEVSMSKLYNIGDFYDE